MPIISLSNVATTAFATSNAVANGLFLGSNLMMTNIATIDSASNNGTLNIATLNAGIVNLATAAATQVVNIGTGAGVTTINIGGPQDTVVVAGSLTYVNTTDLAVSDKNIILNRNGAAASGFSTGISVEEAGANTAYIQTDGSRVSWALKAPASAGIVSITPGASGFTLNQGSHDPMTLGASSNGMSLTNQVLSLSAASSSSIGALSSADWTTFNAKQPAMTGAATSIASANLSNSVALVSDASGKVASSAVSAVELGYVSGVTSAIQAQISSKQATITGAASSIASVNLSNNAALVSDANGKVASSAITATELGYISGVTSSVQMQLDAHTSNINANNQTNITKIGYQSAFAASNIAVGKSNALFPLDVNGDINFSGTLRSNGIAYVGSQFSIYAESNIYLSAGSNLAIGKSNAAYTLDIVGDINFTGTLRSNGFIYSSGSGGSSSVNGGMSNGVALAVTSLSAPSYFELLQNSSNIALSGASNYTSGTFSVQTGTANITTNTAMVSYSGSGYITSGAGKIYATVGIYNLTTGAIVGTARTTSAYSDGHLVSLPAINFSVTGLISGSEYIAKIAFSSNMVVKDAAGNCIHNLTINTVPETTNANLYGSLPEASGTAVYGSSSGIGMYLGMVSAFKTDIQTSSASNFAPIIWTNKAVDGTQYNSSSLPYTFFSSSTIAQFDVSLTVGGTANAYLQFKLQKSNDNVSWSDVLVGPTNPNDASNVAAQATFAQHTDLIHGQYETYPVNYSVCLPVQHSTGQTCWFRIVYRASPDGSMTGCINAPGSYDSTKNFVTTGTSSFTIKEVSSAPSIAVSGPGWAQDIATSNVSYLAGNVGVGKLAPQCALDVLGDINFSGTLRSNGQPFVLGGQAASVAWSNIIGAPGGLSNLISISSVFAPSYFELLQNANNLSLVNVAGASNYTSAAFNVASGVAGTSTNTAMVSYSGSGYITSGVGKISASVGIYNSNSGVLIGTTRSTSVYSTGNLSSLPALNFSVPGLISGSNYFAKIAFSSNMVVNDAGSNGVHNLTINTIPEAVNTSLSSAIILSNLLPASTLLSASVAPNYTELLAPGSQLVFAAGSNYTSDVFTTSAATSSINIKYTGSGATSSGTAAKLTVSVGLYSYPGNVLKGSLRSLSVYSDGGKTTFPSLDFIVPSIPAGSYVVKMVFPATMKSDVNDAHSLSAIVLAEATSMQIPSYYYPNSSAVVSTAPIYVELLANNNSLTIGTSGVYTYTSSPFTTPSVSCSAALHYSGSGYVANGSGLMIVSATLNSITRATEIFNFGSLATLPSLDFMVASLAANTSYTITLTFSANMKTDVNSFHNLCVTLFQNSVNLPTTVATLSSMSNLGLGVQVPQYALDVVGIINCTSNIQTAYNLVLNKSGASNGGANKGLYIEEAGAITGAFKVDASRTAWQLSAPASAGVVSIIPGASNLEVSANTMWAVSSNGNGVCRATGYAGIGTTNPVGPLHVMAPNGSNALCVNSNAFVAIGKSNAAYALDIVGSINMTGQLLLNGSAYNPNLQPALSNTLGGVKVSNSNGLAIAADGMLSVATTWDFQQVTAESVFTPISSITITFNSPLQTYYTSTSTILTTSTLMTVSLSLKAGDLVELQTRVHGETNGNEYDTRLSFWKVDPNTQANTYDLAMCFYAASKTTTLPYANITKTSTNLLAKFDSQGAYFDNDFSSTPWIQNARAIYRTPVSGTTTFYVVISGPSQFAWNRPWSLIDEQNYERGTSLFTARVLQ